MRLSDITQGWTAGDKTSAGCDNVGLVISDYTSTEIVFAPGSGFSHYSLAFGDSFTMNVLGASLSGTGPSLSGTLVATIGVGSEPHGVSSDGTHVWVTNYGANTVSEIVVPFSLTLLSPDQLAVGAAGTVTFAGAGFVTGATIRITGPSTKVTASKITVNGTGTSMTAKVKAAASAPSGVYSVTVTDPDKSTAVCTGCLTVIAPPTLASLSPPSLAKGAKKVPVTLSGTGFATGAKVKGPAGVTFTNVVVVNATTITATATVSSTATVGTHQAVTITNNAAAGYGKATAKILTVT
jgi:hypothetical protein